MIYNISWYSAEPSENLQQYTVVSHGRNCMAGNFSVLPTSTHTLVPIQNGNMCNLTVVVTDKCNQNEESGEVTGNIKCVFTM